MNNAMRRADRQLTDEETIRLFQTVEYGVLSVIDENNMPYGVPMSFALCDDVLYFHRSAAGRKSLKHPAWPEHILYSDRAPTVITAAICDSIYVGYSIRDNRYYPG